MRSMRAVLAASSSNWLGQPECAEVEHIDITKQGIK